LHVTTDYGGQGAYGAQPWQAGQPGSGMRRRPGRSRAGGAAAVALLLLGVTGLGVSLVGVAMQLLPRHFTVRQQQQIVDWEFGKRWRELQAGAIFPASVQYPPPSPLATAKPIKLTASRIGIARQASCAAAADAAVSAVLDRNGCRSMLRATYVDATDSYVVTIGVAVFPGMAQASASGRELAAIAQGAPSAGRGSDAAVLGVRPVHFNGTPAASFTSGRRQISVSMSAGTYVIFYTIGYADDRPNVPVAADSYTNSEMTSLAVGVRQAVVTALAAPVPIPHCPGTPGC
jgi:hypothetical protein